MQVVVTASAVPATQLAGSTGVAAIVGVFWQAVAVKPLAEVGPLATQLALVVHPDTAGTHAIRMKVLPASGVCAVQLATRPELATDRSAAQTVRTKLLPLTGDDVVHDATGTLLVLVAGGLVQVVVIQLGDVGPLALQVATGTLLVLLAAGKLQVVLVQLLPASAGVLVHDWTGLAAVLLLLQVMAVVPLVPAVQVCTGTLLLSTCVRQAVVTLPETPFVQLAVCTSGVVVFTQDVVVQLLPLEAVAGVQAVSTTVVVEVGASHVVVV